MHKNTPSPILKPRRTYSGGILSNNLAQLFPRKATVLVYIGMDGILLDNACLAAVSFTATLK